MLSLTVATLAFLAIHFLVSGTRLRGRLVAMVGEGAYLGAGNRHRHGRSHL